MRTVCHSCEAQYEIPDNKVQTSDILVRCSNCRAIMVVNRRAGNIAEAIPSNPNLSLLADERTDDGSSISARMSSLEEPTRPDLPTSRRRQRPELSSSGLLASVEEDGPFADLERRAMVSHDALEVTNVARRRDPPGRRERRDEKIAQLTREELARPLSARDIQAGMELDSFNDSTPPLVISEAEIALESSPVVVETPEPLTVVKPRGARCASAFVAGFLGVGLVLVVGLYTVPALLF